ncbi:MAG: sulfotransferase domain-containing protein [Pseudomonadota bacterium]|nr:sulfotransferase domain-containing protein [Pseudomonadota bacterium]
MTRARILRPATAVYRGEMTVPERWETWTPREGDVLVCTPPKCGTTWTQTMVAMLLAGRPALDARIGEISPWVDSRLGAPEAVRAALAAQPGRRVVKTHAPADGFPVWEGVTVIAVYRHPLDVFASLLSHVRNRADRDGHPMMRPVDEALRDYIDAPLAMDRFDDDTLATVVRHYTETALSDRLPDRLLLHYADLARDHRGALARIAAAIGAEADAGLLDAIAAATRIDAMRADAHLYAPAGGEGFWRDDAGFFAKGGTDRWREVVPEAALPAYRARLAELVPDPAARDWLEHGDGGDAPRA